jgi:hypothetical protein
MAELLAVLGITLVGIVDRKLALVEKNEGLPDARVPIVGARGSSNRDY